MCVCVGDWLGQVCPPVLQIHPKNVFFSTNRRTEGCTIPFLSPLVLVCSLNPLRSPKGGERISSIKLREIIREIRRMVHVAMCCAHVWTHACMKCVLQAPLQVQQGPSGRLEAVWTKIKVKGYEVARLLCVSTNVCACVCIHLPVLVIPCPITRTCCYHPWKWNHMFPDSQHAKNGLCENTRCYEKPPWESPYSNIAHRHAAKTHTQSHWAIGCFLMSNLFKEMSCHMFSTAWRSVGSGLPN